MKCPECGGEIGFSYITPTRNYRIENDIIIRDDAWTGPQHDESYLSFQCTEDTEHNIDTPEISEWSEKIEHDFYESEVETL